MAPPRGRSRGQSHGVDPHADRVGYFRAALKRSLSSSEKFSTTS